MAQAAAAVIPLAQFEQLRAARAIIQHEADSLSQLARRLDTSFCDAVERILHSPGCLILTGVGKAGLIAQKLVATFCSTGTRSFFLHPTEALHGDLGCLTANDLLLVLSNSGETEELQRLLPVVKSMSVPILAMTARPQSILGQAAEIVLNLGKLTEAGLHGLPPTSSTAAMLAMGDALALVVAETRGFTPQQFGQFHPAGSLGRRLASIQDVMRRGSDVRIASQDDTIRQVLTTLCRPGRRTGAVMLVDAEGCLSGLFTDSDLARLLEQRHDDQLDLPICDVMTRAPITLSDQALLADGVQILSDRRLSELPVIDDHGRPVGLLDITDVIGLMPADM